MDTADINLGEMTRVIGLVKSDSSGIDGLNLQTFKLDMVYLLRCLVYLIDLLLKMGEFPLRLKEVTVIPLYKEGLKTDPLNWRLISMLSSFSS